MKEKQLASHLPSPPTYARRGSPTYESYQNEERLDAHWKQCISADICSFVVISLLFIRDKSSSRSSSSEPEGQVEFITEFGGHSDSEPANDAQIAPSHVSPSETKSKSSSVSSKQDRKRKRSRSRDLYGSSSSSKSKRRAQRSPSPRSYRRRSRSR